MMPAVLVYALCMTVFALGGTLAGILFSRVPRGDWSQRVTGGLAVLVNALFAALLTAGMWEGQ